MIEGNRLMTFVPVSNAEKARNFYRDTLGLRLISEDSFALVFDVEGVTLRATLVSGFTPQPFTVLGWQVRDARALAKAMAAGGIALERFSGMSQDEDGLWKSPGGALIGWFKDPDGNVLSITQFPCGQAS
jgi:catechol 2,3-dioxygenase-like lactoylglutathione lyase family enzyme